MDGESVGYFFYDLYRSICNQYIRDVACRNFYECINAMKVLSK